MRVTLIEALCLVAIGATMVELNDSRRVARTSTPRETALATAERQAAPVGTVRSQPSLLPTSSAGNL